MSYSWNNFSVIDENSIRTDSNFSTGDSFTYGGADATMWVWDNDSTLAGDRGANEQGSDWQPGWIYQDGQWEQTGNVYWEGYFVLTGSDGKCYYLIEIEGTCLEDGGNDHFAFYGSVPPMGTTLTASAYYGDCGSLSYRCLDGGPMAPTATAPDATDDHLEVFQGEMAGEMDLNVLNNDSSNTSQALIVKQVDGSASAVGVWVELASGGRVLIAANGDVDFDAEGDFDALGAGETATVSITYTVQNSDGLTDTATLNIVVTGVDDAPVAVDQAVRTNEDTSVSGNVLQGSFDVDGDTVELGQVIYNGQAVEIGVETSVVTEGGYTGTLVVQSNGDFTFTPGADANAMSQGDVDQFSFQFTVLSGGAPGENLIINGEFENNPLNNSGWGTYTAIEGWTATSGRIEVQESTYGGDKANGDAVIELDSHNGPNGANNSSMAQTVSIQTAGSYTLSMDYAPRANPQGVIEATSIINVLVNGEIVMELSSNVVKYENYSIDLNLAAGDNVISFEAAGLDDTYGGRIDSVSLVHNNAGALESALQTATVTIDGLSDAPVVIADFATTDEDSGVSGNLLDNDTDVVEIVGTSLGEVGQTYEVTTAGGYTGFVTVNADGTYTYTPGDDAQAMNDGDVDTFTFTYTAAGEGTEQTTTFTQTELSTVVAAGDGQQSVTFVSDGAGYRNSFGSYVIDENGNITGVEIVFADASDDKVALGTSAGRDFVAGQQVGYFLLQNGASQNNFSQFTGGEFQMRNADGSAANIDGVGSKLVYVKDNGTEIAVTGNTFHTVATGDLTKLNNDNFDHVSRIVDPATGAVTYGFEDLTNGGDKDFNDVVFSVSGSFTVVEDTRETASTTVTITISGLTDNLPPVVQVETNATDDVTPVSGDLLDDATDADNDALTIVSTSAGAVGEAVSVTTDGGQTGTLIVNADGTYTFTPDGTDLDLGETDTVSFTFVVTDGTEQVSSSAVITITGLNEGPVATAQTFSISEANAQGENNVATGNLLDGAVDADGDALSIQSISAGALDTAINVTTVEGKAAILTVSADGSFTLVSADDSLDLGDTDSYAFDFTVASSGGTTVQTDTQTATVNIAGVNVGPVATAQSFAISEANNQGANSVASGNLLDGAVDADGDALSIQSISAGALDTAINVTTVEGKAAILTVSADGSFTLVSADDRLDLGDTDSYAFDFTVASSGGTTVQTDTQTATVNIAGVNVGPIAAAKTFAISEANDQGANSVASGNLLIGAVDADGDAISIQSISAGALNTAINVTTVEGKAAILTVNSNGSFTLVSADDSLDLGENDSYEFEFTIASSGGTIVQTDTQTATVNIAGVNVGPVTQSKTFQIAEQNDQGLVSTLNNNLLAGAFDAEGDQISIFSTSIGAVGETVIVQTTGGRDAELTINADGTFTLASLDSTMDLNQSDSVVIQFTAVSSGGTTDQFSTSTASISINGVNVAPIAGNVTGAISEQNTTGQVSTISGNLFANSSDADGDDLVLASTTLGVIGQTVSVTTASGKTGDLTLAANGDYTFTSTSTDLDVGDTDSLTFGFTVSSTAGTTVQQASASATINIAGVNAPPVALDQSYTTDEDTQLNGVNILQGAFDEDGDTVTLQSLGNGLVISSGFFATPNQVTTDGGMTGTLVITANGNLQYTPSAAAAEAMNDGDIDTFTFQYTVESNDGGTVQTDTKQVVITITGADDPVNMPPVAIDQSYVTDEDTQLTAVNILQGSSDVDGDVVSLSSLSDGLAISSGFFATPNQVTTAAGLTGTLIIAANGDLQYTPSEAAAAAMNDGDIDTFTFQYTVQSSDGMTVQFDTKQVTITITGADEAGNMPPVAVNQSYMTDEDTQLNGVNILQGSSDVDGDVVSLSSLSGGLAISSSFFPTPNQVTTASGLTGTLVVFADGSLRYAPSIAAAEAMNAGDIDTFTFEYTVQSSDGVTTQFDTKQVTITITGADDGTGNTPPVVTGDIITIGEAETATGDLSNLVSDADAGDVVTIDAINGVALVPGASIELTSQGGLTGTLVVDANGGFTFDPSVAFLDLNTGESDIVSFEYTASDLAGASGTATVQIVVEGEGGTQTADVNYYFLIDSSQSMFVTVPGLDCDANGDGMTSWVDLSIDLSGQLANELPMVWGDYTNLTVDSSFFTYGSIAQEVASPYDIDGSLASSSNLGGALASLTAELDATKDNRIFVFSGGGSSNADAADEITDLVANFNAQVSMFAIGPEFGLQGLLENLLVNAGIGGDVPVIDDCGDVMDEVDEQIIKLDDELFFQT